MNAKNITAVAVSGGMDSLYALLSLREKGERAFALHARLLPDDLAPKGYEAMLERLDATCASRGVALYVVDCAKNFTERVIEPFIKAYALGLTPNPCAHCNAAIKFGLLWDIAQNLGATRIATGHYARMEQDAKGVALFAGSDAAKDQSYFLSLVSREQLARAVTPMEGITKNAARAWLASRGVEIPSPKESQEICFVPDDDYRAFVQKRAAAMGISLPGPGLAALPDGTPVGKHKGLWQYTEGQRRGLGIAWKEPLYVLEKDLKTNTLVTGGKAQLTGDCVKAGQVNFLVPFAEWPETVLLRTRFRQKPQEAHVSYEGETLVFREKTPGGPYAQGQIAVAYTLTPPEDGARLRVLGGGVISN